MAWRGVMALAKGGGKVRRVTSLQGGSEKVKWSFRHVDSEGTMGNVWWKADGMSLTKYLCFAYGSLMDLWTHSPENVHMCIPEILHYISEGLWLPQTHLQNLWYKAWTTNGGWRSTNWVVLQDVSHQPLLASRILPFLVPTFLSDHYFSISLFGS